MVSNHPPIATPFNNFCPKTLSNQARHQACGTLGARDFSSAVSGLCQVFIVTRAFFSRLRLLVASAYGRRCVGLRPTPKISSAREKNLWYPG